MNPQLTQLLKSIDCVVCHKAEITPDLLKAIPRYDNGLSPWASWALLCLARHRVRQEWLAGTIVSQFGADLAAIAAGGAFAHPEVPQKGVVPNAIDWEYYFHGRGCCFTHRNTGERIDVDFFDETADWFDQYFFVWYLRSLKTPPFAEARLLALHGADEAVILSIRQLMEIGLLERPPDRGCFRLTSDSRLLDESLDALEPIWETKDGSLAVAAALGDWVYVSERLGPDDPDLADIQVRARYVRDTENRRLEKWFSGEHSRLVIQAMAGLNHPKLNDYLERAIQDKPSGTVVEALEVIAKLPESRWNEPLNRLLDRVNPNGDIPEPHIWIVSAGCFLRRGYRTREILNRLATLQQRELAEAGMLALEFMPSLAIPLFRRGLRSRIPCERTTAAAALAILDEVWSREELAAVLRESDEQLATAECRAALVTSQSTDMHRLVMEWEDRNPREPESGPWISMEEMLLKHCDGHLQYEMEKLHDRVLRLRGQVRAKPSSKWEWFRSRFFGG
jgi:hypothetical protein